MKENMTTVKLVNNTSFPTYQLYGEIENKELDVLDRFKIAILESLKWLKSRFENIGLPKELDLPGPDNYRDFNLSVFKDGLHIDEGYSLDILYLEDEKIWTMNLVEPDLALGIGQERRGVPGRKFSTNIGFVINKNEVECGFKTVCIEPQGTEEPCEVFRIAVVKEIVRNKNLGLKQIYPLREEAFKIDDFEALMKFKAFLEHDRRQIPIVIMVELIDKSFEELKTDYFSSGRIYTGVGLPIDLKDKDIGVKFETNLKEKRKLPLDLSKDIKYKMSQGHFFYLDFDMIEKYNQVLGKDYDLYPGELGIIFPKAANRIDLKFSQEEIKEARNIVRDKVMATLEEYTKYRDYDYGNVEFYGRASMTLQNKIQSKSRDTKEIIDSLKLQLDIERENFLEEENRQKNEIAELSRQNHRYIRKIESLEDRLSNIQEDCQRKMEKSIEGHRKKLDSLETYVDWLESTRLRPDRLEDIPEWVESRFRGRMILHQRAIDEVRSSKNSINIDILCDALDYLGSEYYDVLFKGLDKDTSYSLCSKKYKRPFDVGNTGDKSVRYYPGEYKIKYRLGHKGRPVETAMNMHLKLGNDNNNMIRIYFLLDREEKLIVIGSMPDHLPTLNF